jgi:hypothetical protein
MPWSFKAFSDFHQELMAAQHAAMAIAVKVQVAVDLCGAELNDILELFMDDGDNFLHFPVVMGVVIVGDADEQGDEDAVHLFHQQVPARNAGRERQVQMAAGLQQVHPGRLFIFLEEELQELLAVRVHDGRAALGAPVRQQANGDHLHVGRQLSSGSSSLY